MRNDPGPRARLVTIATAVALFRGGMDLCPDLLVRLDAVLRSLGGALDEDLREVAGAGRALCDARIDGDVSAFDEAKLRLWRELARYWAGRAIRPFNEAGKR
ncbi:hypothetical protein [Salipiger bermudensis]|uniref:hypothetical protein n=1 Tax=Salipiger bermudensis TaxID=344736 RepID=UPI00300A3C9B